MSDENPVHPLPWFEYDIKRATALAEHLGVPLEEIKVVEGEGLHVYAHVEPGQTQEEGEEENGRWLVSPEEEFQKATIKLVTQSLHTYYADALGAAIFGDDTGNFKLLLRRALNIWAGKQFGEKAPTLDEAIQWGLSKPSDIEDVDRQDPWSIMKALGNQDSDLEPLIELCINPKPNTEELRVALEKVVDVERLIEIAHDQDGYEGIWGVAEYETKTLEDETYHLLRKQ